MTRDKELSFLTVMTIFILILKIKNNNTIESTHRNIRNKRLVSKTKCNLIKITLCDRFKVVK